MKTSFLGNSSKRIKKSGINLLDSISRIKEDINHGSDIWNVYDFMYLDKNKIPSLKVFTTYNIGFAIDTCLHNSGNILIE